MNIADTIRGPQDPTQRRWQQRTVGEIRRRVRRERTWGMSIEQCCRHHLARQRPEDAVAVLAELAGVDWLYNPNTGKVWFFEFS